MKLFNHSEVNTLSQFDMDEEFGVPYFWDGIAQWLHTHHGASYKTGHDMIHAGIQYVCEEAGSYYDMIDSEFIQEQDQHGIESEVWGSCKREVAKVDDEVVGVDVCMGYIMIEGNKHRLLKVMSPECVSYFVALN